MSGKDPDPSGSVIDSPPGSRSGYVSQKYGSADPDPKEIFTDPFRNTGYDRFN
jgi:hypothetical protein